MKLRWDALSGLLGLILLLVGSYIGLFVAPPERYMGEVARILFVHVPTAWIAMLCLTAAFAFAVASLWTRKQRWDAAQVGAIEAGVVLTALLLVQGIIWGRATWWEGTKQWWTWDVRLTFSLVMLLLFAAILALRAFVDDAERRRVWSAVATIVAFVDVPLVYFCVRWWRSLHQVQSTPDTVSPGMTLPLRINAFALLFLAVWFIAQRARLELERRRRDEVTLPEVIGGTVPSGGSIGEEFR